MKIKVAQVTVAVGSGMVITRIIDTKGRLWAKTVTGSDVSNWELVELPDDPK